MSADSREARAGKRADPADYLPERYRNLPTCKSWDSYMGTHRKAQLPDELGASHVVETMFSDGVRLAFFKIPNSDRYEVRTLPAPPIASGEGLTWR